ncbi:hypothetical protein PoB_000815700 [Plakobranchus ocellatus]|uniref:Uncharacterized protein n=1 Tax=Plakobranchus ocellatus TaxID=259542 RepID=A0AAV3YHG2_9GAST|nr:hypothetical protein PoB_000815700 [Plakobranchus ocellatus]
MERQKRDLNVKIHRTKDEHCVLLKSVQRKASQGYGCCVVHALISGQTLKTTQPVVGFSDGGVARQPTTEKHDDQRNSKLKNEATTSSVTTADRCELLGPKVYWSRNISSTNIS